MNLDEAYEKAKQEKQDINHFAEYKEAYVFSFDPGYPTKGGDMPIVVPKDGTRCINFLYAIQETDMDFNELLDEGTIESYSTK